MANGFGGGGAEYVLQTKVESSGVSQFTNKIGGAGSAVGGLRTKVAATGAVLAGGFAAALAGAAREAAEFETAMADVEKVTDASTMEEMRGEIMRIASEVPIAQNELAELATQAGKFGVEGSENISKFVETVGQISSATDLAAEEAGTRFAKIAGAVGMPMSEIDKLGNAVNSLADSMKTDANEITDTATRASNVLSQQLGLSEDSVLALSASMNEVSSSSRLAAGSLRSAAEALMDPKKVEDIAGALGMQVGEFRRMREESPEQLLNRVATEMNNGGDSARELSVAVGKRATRAFSQLGSQLDRTEGAKKNVNEQFRNGTSLSREMAIRTNTAAGQWQLFRNRVRNAAIQTGEHLLPAVKQVLSALNSGIRVLSRFNSRTNGMAGAVIGVTGFVVSATAAIGALTAGLGASTTAMAAASGAASALTTSLALLTGPIGLVVAALAGLGVAYKTNLFGFRDAVDSVVASVRPAFRATAQTIRTEVPAAFRVIRDAVLTILRPFLTVARELWSQHGTEIMAELRALRRITQEIFRGIADVVVPITRSTTSILRQTWNLFGDDVVTILRTWKSLAVTIFGTAFDLILTNVRVALNTIKGITRAAMAFLRGDFDESLSIIRETFFTNLSLIEGFFRRTFGRIRGFVVEWGPRFIGAIRNILSAAYNAFAQWGNSLIFGSLIPNIYSSILAATQNFGSRMISALNSLSGSWLSVVASWMGSTRASVKSGLMHVLSSAQQFGANLLNWLSSMTSSFVGIWNRWLSTTANAISQTFLNIGRFIDNWSGRFLNTTASFTSRAWDAWRTFLRTTATGIEQTFTNIFGFMSNFFSNLLTMSGNRLHQLHQRFGQFLFNTAQRIHGWIQNVINRFNHLHRSLLAIANDGLYRLHQRFGQFMFNTLQRFHNWSGNVRRTVGGMLGDLRKMAYRWVDHFVQPFQNAKQRVLRQFRQLKRRVSGNSIVPDMLDETLEQTASWSGEFAGAYSATADDVASQFGYMEDAASSPTPMGDFGDVGGFGGGGGSNLSDVHSELSTQTGIMADAFGGGGGGGLSGQDLADTLSEEVFGEWAHGAPEVFTNAIREADVGKIVEQGWGEKAKQRFASKSELRRDLLQAVRGGEVSSALSQASAVRGALNTAMDKFASERNLDADVRRGLKELAGSDKSIFDVAGDTPYGVEGLRALSEFGASQGGTQNNFNGDIYASSYDEGRAAMQGMMDEADAHLR